MANFGTAFGLCSITDSRSLLGVSGDDEGCAIVTLGKSMVIRCRLSDQKQLNSWSSALPKLTSKVVWNSIDQTLVGVFDDVYVKQWKRTDPGLEKAQKWKFKNNIHELLTFSKDNTSRNSQLIILFKNGSIRDLESGLKEPKKIMTEVIQPQEQIENADIVVDGDDKYLILITRFENKYRHCYCIQLEKDKFETTENIKKIKVRRRGTSLLGNIIFKGDSRYYLLTFWTDGSLFSIPLPLKQEHQGVGKYLGTTNVVSHNSEISMQAASKDQVAIYGALPTEEGAFLGIYNIKFGITQADTSFKMFNKPPKMWLIENNLVIVLGQRLICVPFDLQTEKLSALVGSRRLRPDLKNSEVCAIIPTAVWSKALSNSSDELGPDCPKTIRNEIKTFMSEGWSEQAISQALMTHLIEAKDIDALLWCLNNFTDIPEDELVRILAMALTQEEGAGEEQEQQQRNELINKILTTPVDKYSLANAFRALLLFENSLLLLEYFRDLLSEEGIRGDVHVKDAETVLNWATTLVDAFYQRFVLSRDSRVQKVLRELKEKIEENILVTIQLQSLVPFIMGLKKGKTVATKPKSNASYSVEKIRLYEDAD